MPRGEVDATAVKLAKALLRAGDHDGFHQLLRERPGLAKDGSVVIDAARLHVAKAVRALAKAGADLDGSSRGYRPLHAAIQEKPHQDGPSGDKARIATVKTLLTLGANAALTGGWPAMPALQVACGVGDRELVDLLVKHLGEVDGFAAAALGDLARIRKEIAADDAFANAKDASSLMALHYAACSRLHRDEKIARNLRAIATELLAAGANPDATARSWSHDVTAIDLAISAHHLPLVEIFLRSGADATRAFATALWNTGDGFKTYGELCLRNGADPNRTIYEKKPLLNQLVRWGQVKQVLWLASLGADANIPDDRGWTAMHQAASRGNRRMWDALLAAGGDAKHKAKDGATPQKLRKG
jgi:ankyrin repeat protein